MAGRQLGRAVLTPRRLHARVHDRAGRVARLRDQFAARDTKVAAVSVDPATSHRAWAADIAETQGADVNFPLIADPDRHVATLYGMIHPRHDSTATVRSVFVIGP